MTNLDSASSHEGCLSVVRACVRSHVPVILWADPGTGKTAAVREMAEELKEPCETVIASLRDPSEFAGMAVRTPAGIVLEPPAWAKRLAAAGRGMVFFDEVSCTLPSVQAALLRVVDERVVGDLALPREVSIIAAANPVDSAAGGWDLSAASANRWLHVQWAGWSASQWCSWALSQGWGDVGGTTAAYLAAHAEALHQMPVDMTTRGAAWPSRRTWARGCQVLKTSGAPLHHEMAVAIMAAAVGPAAAKGWSEYVRRCDLPDPEALLAEPGRLVLPPRGDQILAALGSVTAAVLGKKTGPRWTAALRVMARAAELGAVGQAAIPCRTLARSGSAAWHVPKELDAFKPALQASGLWDRDGKGP